MAATGRIRTILIFLMAPLAVYLAILNLVDRVTFRTPSDGFVWEQTDEGLRVLESKSSSAAQTIGVGNLLIDVNGLSIKDLDEYTEIVEALSEASPEGVTVDYTFRSVTGSEITVPVRLALEPQLKAGDLPMILVAIAFILIGILTFLKAARAPGAFHFALICLIAFCLFLFRYSGRADFFDIVVYWLSAVAFLLLPPLFLHFSMVFPETAYEVRRRPYLKQVAYLPAFLLLGLHVAWFLGFLQGFGVSRTPAGGTLLDKLELLHFIAFLGIAAAILISKSRSASRVVERKQMQWITIGTLLGFLPLLVFYAIPFLLNLPIRGWMESSVLSVVFVPLSFGYAITKFRLRDVELIFKRGAAYVIASSALLAFYVGIALLVARALQRFSPESSFLVLAVSALAVAAFFAPLRDRIQEQLDRYFYKDRYSYRRSFVDFGRTLASEVRLPELTELISNRIRKTLDVTPVTIFLKDERETSWYRLETASGLLSSTRPEAVELSQRLAQLLAVEAGSLDLDQVSEAMLPNREEFFGWGIRYLEPLSVRGRLIGFMGLGRRKNGDYLNSEDLELLTTLSGYAAIALDNALLYRSLESKAEELVELRIYSENVIESISHGVVVISVEGEITVWNGAIAALTGVPKDEAIGRPIADVLPRELTRLLREVVDGPDWLVKDSTQLFRAHLEIDGEDGRESSRLINVTLSPFISHQNLNIGTLLVIDDITEKIRLESQLQQAERLSSIGLFAAGLAHEVNTPLAGISSFAQMLLDETSADDPRRELLKKIEHQSFRASEIVNNLLNFARFSDRDFEEVNLNSLMLDTLSLLEHQFRKGHIDVDMDFDPSLPKTVGNGGKLQQVFMNLFLNARDSMPSGGKLRLRSRKENSELVVEVQDTGTGISKEDIKRIYDPFFTTKPVGKGTGLGLSVSYGIIQEHSGRISVASEPGRGTTFSLYLPLKRVH